MRRPSDAHGILVTGTDTGIGKTLVSCAIITALCERGIKVGVYKPAETDCEMVNDRLEGSDCRQLVTAAGGGQKPHEAASYLFEVPAAPLVAAETAGATIEPGRLLQDFAKIAVHYNFVVVEGAGGLLVPLAESFTYLDLAGRLRIPVVCVVGSRLGCINHALLTLAVLEHAGLPIAGYVMNALEQEPEYDVAARTNGEMIARFTEQRCLGTFPYVPAAYRNDFGYLADLAETHLDLVALA